MASSFTATTGRNTPHGHSPAGRSTPDSCRQWLRLTIGTKTARWNGSGRACRSSSPIGRDGTHDSSRRTLVSTTLRFSTTGNDGAHRSGCSAPLSTMAQRRHHRPRSSRMTARKPGHTRASMKAGRFTSTKSAATNSSREKKKNYDQLRAFMETKPSLHQLGRFGETTSQSG